MPNPAEINERVLVPKFGEWEHKELAFTNYSVVFSQARANRKQQRDAWRSLGNELDLAAASLRHGNQDSVTDNKIQHKTVVGAANDSMSMSRGRSDRNQLKTKVSCSLGNEQGFVATSSAPHQQGNGNDPVVSNSCMLVPEFGGWDRKAPGSLGYTIEFSQAQTMKKQQKSDEWHSLGNDRDFIAVPSPQSQLPRHDNNQYSAVVNNAQKTVPEFGEWDWDDAKSMGYTMEFSQARANKKQRKSDGRSSLGSEQDSIPRQLPHRQEKNDYVSNNSRMVVPKFGGWDQSDVGSIDYTIEFSRARANKKRQKCDIRSSLGSEQDFVVALSPLQPIPRQLPYRQDKKRKKILTYITSCFRP